jgi:(p)ppGpp synthase/HD superfamily hydrolase
LTTLYGDQMTNTPMQTTILGERFDAALTFTAQVHCAQVRKGSGLPYLGHLLGVCSLVIEDGGSEDEAIAALLHDAVEDQGGETMLAQVRVRFGDEVAAIVAACSDTAVEPKPPWRERKQAYLEHLPAASPSAIRVSLADKLFNARAILRDLRTEGEVVWTRFKAGRDQQLWYYGSLAELFLELTASPMARDLSDTVAAIRG